MQLGQYYTENIFCDLVVNHIKNINPLSLLELGAGQGNLLNAARKKWKDVNIISTDVDIKNYKYLKHTIPNAKHYNQDVIDENLSVKLGLFESLADVAVCNPPYTSITFDQKVKRILKNSGFDKNTPSSTKIMADLVFLAQNLNLLKKGGELGIVLPDSFLTSHKYEWVRDILLENHCIGCIIDLPEKIFSKTEAKTHILIINKGVRAEIDIPVYKSDNLGNITDKFSIKISDAKYRMDYDYNKWKSMLEDTSSVKSLGKIAEIKRGNITKKDAIDSNIEFFHTTDFKSLEGRNLEQRRNNYKKNYLTARKGDILLARVGKRCIGKVTLVKSGEIAITDCVYRIRVNKKYQKILFESLVSAEGQKWLKMHSHGVCSKVISKTDLVKYKF